MIRALFVLLFVYLLARLLSRLLRSSPPRSGGEAKQDGFPPEAGEIEEAEWEEIEGGKGESP